MAARAAKPLCTVLPSATDKRPLKCFISRAATTDPKCVRRWDSGSNPNPIYQGRPSMSKHPLTKRLVRSLEITGDDYYIIDDPRNGGERGLSVKVSRTGLKTFMWRRSVNGKRMSRTIGEYPTISVVDARRAARELNYQRDTGRLNVLGHTLTFREFFENYYLSRALPHLSRSTRRNYMLSWGRVDGLHGKRLADIRTGDIAQIHADIGSVAPSMANTVRAFLSTVLNRAVEWGFIEKCPRMPRKFPENKRTKYLDRDELTRLLTTLNGYKQPYALLFQILLFTGARKQEACSMRWDEIDFEAHIWRHAQKGRRQVLTPLSDISVRALLEWRRTLSAHVRASQEAWVFPSQRSRTGHLVNPDKHWRTICRIAELEEITIHGLRHTLATWMAKSKSSPYAIKTQLGHQQLSTTEIYTHESVQDATEALNDTVKEMTSHTLKRLDAA